MTAFLAYERWRFRIFELAEPREERQETARRTLWSHTARPLSQRGLIPGTLALSERGEPSEGFTGRFFCAASR
jgi:hypothetical protein